MENNLTKIARLDMTEREWEIIFTLCQVATCVQNRNLFATTLMLRKMKDLDFKADEVDPLITRLALLGKEAFDKNIIEVI